MKKTYLFFSITIIAILGIVFLGNTFIQSTNKATPEENYQEYCASCHGEQLKSFVNRKWQYGKSWNEVFKSIKYGSPDDGMPAYQETFSDKELQELTTYILTGIEDLEEENFEQTAKLSPIIKSEAQTFRLDTVVTGLAIPWGLDFLQNGDMLITERSGELYRFSKGKLQEIAGVPEVRAKGQGGLLDVRVSPFFKNVIYLSYSKPKENQATTAIMRAKLKKNKLTDQKVIFEADPYSRTRHHYGSRIAFDKNGFLYFSVGDRGNRGENPQSLANHCGKIHRLREDGTLPKDNPFMNDAKAKKSIYSYGHRNPQGLVMHPETGEIWAHEHGPKGGDEVNIIKKGANYGWPVISYGINYVGTKFTDITEKEGMEQPENYWVPSIAPCGMAFVSGDKYPNWKNDLLVGSLRFDYIARLKMDGNKVLKEEKLLKNVGRIRDIKMGKDGYIYFSVEGEGAIFRIVPE